MSIPGIDTPDVVEVALGGDLSVVLDGTAVIVEAAIISMTGRVVSHESLGVASRKNLVASYVGQNR